MYKPFMRFESQILAAAGFDVSIFFLPKPIECITMAKQARISTARSRVRLQMSASNWTVIASRHCTAAQQRSGSGNCLNSRIVGFFTGRGRQMPCCE